MIELIGESYNPGPVGEVETGYPPPELEPRPRKAVLWRGAFALAMVATPLTIAAVTSPFSLSRVGVVAGVMAVYLLIAYYVHPRPNWDNLGWAGGIVDNPFRYSDDINRGLVFLLVVLSPGRFASTAIVELFRGPPPSTT